VSIRYSKATRVDGTRFSLRVTSTSPKVVPDFGAEIAEALGKQGPR
jgi:hypothetical protein